MAGAPPENIEYDTLQGRMTGMCRLVVRLETLFPQALKAAKSSETENLNSCFADIDSTITETMANLRSLKRFMAQSARENTLRNPSLKREYDMGTAATALFALEDRVSNMELQYFSQMPKGKLRELRKNWRELENTFSDTHGFALEKNRQMQTALPLPQLSELDATATMA